MLLETYKTKQKVPSYVLVLPIEQDVWGGRVAPIPLPFGPAEREKGISLLCTCKITNPRLQIE